MPGDADPTTPPSVNDPLDAQNQEADAGLDRTRSPDRVDAAEPAAGEVPADTNPALSPVAQQPGGALTGGMPNNRERDWKN